MRLIDADAFFEKFRAGGDLYSELLESEDMREILKDEEITPTVDAEPVVHAHWEQFETVGDLYGFPYYGIRCSNCKKDCHDNPTEYCPHCGAKMGGEK